MSNGSVYFDDRIRSASTSAEPLPSPLNQATMFPPELRKVGMSYIGGSGGIVCRLEIWLPRLISPRATNRECRKCLSGVHSTNSKCPTSTGFSHRQSFIFAAVSPSPIVRPAPPAIRERTLGRLQASEPPLKPLAYGGVNRLRVRA